MQLGGGEQMEDKIGDNSDSNDAPEKEPANLLEKKIPSKSKEDQYAALDDLDPIPIEDANDDTLVISIDYDMNEQHAPDAPEFRKEPNTRLKHLHVLGDLHGWAPGLITYLITHKLATIEINGMTLGSKGVVDARAMNNLFARDMSMDRDNLPNAGLKGRPDFEHCVNGSGHYSIHVRWIGGKATGFVQLGDIVDRSDHSELACEILRQLVIDAPSNVFILMGNHEQFLLENEYDNWYLNEKRNAVTDAREKMKKWSTKHLRFLGTIEHDHETRAKHIFRAYKESVELLFLTQAAVQQLNLEIPHGLNESEIKAILSSGWSPYTKVQEISKRFKKRGESFPGALTSLVIGENIFHHAEPNQKMGTLASEMNWQKEFGWLNYVHGGNKLQDSPHSYLLWSRGASDGAASNRPASEAIIEQISIHWPGLYNIIHGHTPTVTVNEFEKFSGGLSVPISYLAEHVDSTPKLGKASHVRIFNVDEGMAPVYYRGNEEPDDPTRVPIGLRITSKANRLKPVEVHSEKDSHLELGFERNIRTDSRKLWVWQEGTTRTNNSSEWKNVADNRWQKTLEHEGITFLVEVSSYGKLMLEKKISGYPILKNLMVYLLDDANIKPRSITRQPPKSVLKHITKEDGPKDFEHMLHKGNSWKTAQKLEMTVLGLGVGIKYGTSTLYSINSMKTGRTLFIHHPNTDNSNYQIQAISVNQIELRHGRLPFCISLSKNENLLHQKLNQWLGEGSFNSKIEATIPLCIGKYPLKNPSNKEKKSMVNKRSATTWKIPTVKENENKQTNRQSTPPTTGNMNKNRSESDVRHPNQSALNKPKAVENKNPSPQRDVRTSEHSQYSQTSETSAQKIIRIGLEKIDAVLGKKTDDDIRGASKPVTNKPKAAENKDQQKKHIVRKTGALIGDLELQPDRSLILKLSPQDCIDILISEGKSKSTKVSCEIIIQASPKWVMVDFEIRKEGESYGLNFPTTAKDYIMNGKLNGNPKTKKNHHGINPGFTKTILQSPLVVERIKACIKEE